MSYFNSAASLLGGQDSPPVYPDGNDPGLSDSAVSQEFGLGSDDTSGLCGHWYDHILSPFTCIGQDVGAGVGAAIKPITNEVNTILIIVVVAVIIIVALVLFGKNTGALASHLRVG